MAALITGMVAIAAIAGVACLIAARRQRKIARYERVLMEAGRLDDVDVDNDYEAPDAAQPWSARVAPRDSSEVEMQPPKNTSSPFHDIGTEI